MINKLVHILLISCLLISCQKPENRDCFKGTGEIISETRNLNAFSHIQVNDNVNVKLIPSPNSKAELIAGKNLMNNIITEVKNDTLIIENINKCNWLRSYKKSIDINLYYSALSSIDFFGGGDIICLDTIKSSTFDLEIRNAGGNVSLILKNDTTIINLHTGPADVTAKGITNNCSAYSAGNGNLLLKDLVSSNSFVNNSGTGKISITATTYLDIQLFFIGDVIYYGHPAGFSTNKVGSGQIIQGD